MNQKEMKALKREVIDEGALNIGFYTDIFEHIPHYALLEAFREVHSQHFELPDDSALDNALVTEAIKAMNYQDFKEVAPSFFGYTKSDDEILSEPLKINKQIFEQLKNDSQELFKLKSQPADYEAIMNKLTHDMKSNGNEILAINPLENEFAVLMDDTWIEPYLAEGLLTNYQTPGYDAGGATQIAEGILSRAPQGFSDWVTEQMQRDTHQYVPADDIFGDEQIIWLADKLGSRFDHDNDFIDKVNHELSGYQMELVTHEVVGYSQGERWNLGYLMDKSSLDEFPKREQVIDYLEHEIGAYYRGSLSEVFVYDANQEIMNSFPIDKELTWNSEVEVVQDYLGKDFTIPDVAIAYNEAGLSKAQISENLKQPLSKQVEIAEQLNLQTQVAQE
ncbi:MAG: hypothetical protein LBI43_06740 [Streptococcaceae bacterium]|jgi:hypothetical protein|nr:hypothetical protein [Streptococcaceae bacterium]